MPLCLRGEESDSERGNDLNLRLELRCIGCDSRRAGNVTLSG